MGKTSDYGFKAMNVKVRTKERLDGVKIIPQEPYSDVIDRLLDEHDRVRE